MNNKQFKNAEILKALGHPIRLCIVQNLCKGKKNVSCMAECLEVSQPTVSQHINVLKAADIIKGIRKGTLIEYSVINNTAKKIIDCIE